MAGSGPLGVPTARWKRHIVRQLRQRDRAQKALFLELVPACECATGAVQDGSGGNGDPGAGTGDCPAPRAESRVQNSLLAFGSVGLEVALSVKRPTSD